MTNPRRLTLASLESRAHAARDVLEGRSDDLRALLSDMGAGRTATNFADVGSACRIFLAALTISEAAETDVRVAESERR